MKKISTVVIMLLLMLASFTAGMEYPRGDVNHDQSVDIDDITCLINYVLNGTWPEDEPETETFTVNGVSFTMVTVEGGTFMMGASDNDSEAYDREKPAHEVTVSSFAIGQTEVTQALWQAVMGNNPSDFADNLQRPVECVSWDDCKHFINSLNQLTGRAFRLPSEAEWEFAARGGNLSHGYKYAGSNNVDEVAWCWDNIPSSNEGTDYGTKMVATKSPNELGLYDMSGNVLEWCQDKYVGYNGEMLMDTTETTELLPNGFLYVNRGGSWRGLASGCRVSSRSYDFQNETLNIIGLRLAL